MRKYPPASVALKDKPRRKSTRPRRPERKFRDVYGLISNLEDHSYGMSVHEMADAELFMIGMITVQWAYLEHALLMATAKMANRAKMEQLPQYAESLNFIRRLRAWRLTMEQAVKGKLERQHFQKLGQRIARVHGDRNKVTHGLWQFLLQKPWRLKVYSFRPFVEFSDPQFSFDRLRKIHDEIALINFEISRPFGRGSKKHHQKLWTDGIKDAGGSYASRRYLLDISGHADLLANWQDQATIEERRRQLRTSFMPHLKQISSSQP